MMIMNVFLRWEEKKKWEGKLTSIKKRLDESQEMVAKLSKTNQSLREMANRVEREKAAAEAKVKAMQKALQVNHHSPPQ